MLNLNDLVTIKSNYNERILAHVINVLEPEVLPNGEQRNWYAIASCGELKTMPETLLVKLQEEQCPYCFERKLLSVGASYCSHCGWEEEPYEAPDGGFTHAGDVTLMRAL